MLGFCTAKAIKFSLPLFRLILFQTLLKFTRAYRAWKALLSTVDYDKLNLPDCKFTVNFIQMLIFTIVLLNDTFDLFK